MDLFFARDLTATATAYVRPSGLCGPFVGINSVALTGTRSDGPITVKGNAYRIPILWLC